MKTIQSILEAIGNTPLLKLRNVPSHIQASVWMKLEFLNPSGSLKDRIALRMIEDAEKQGGLDRGLLKSLAYRGQIVDGVMIAIRFVVWE